MSLRRALVLACVLAQVVPLVGTTAAPLESEPWARRIARAPTPWDPPRFDYDDAVVERALVTARDGITTLALDVIRPRTDEPVPTIFLQSPYYNTLGRGWRGEHKTPWMEPATTPGPVTPFPEWYDEYFVPRGYAIVLQDMRGTRNSSGCQVYGGPEEIADAVDVIGWIARQSWSNHRVGMTGGSYDGTVAVGAAAAGPRALKAIIPIRAIDRWYDYHFFNGVQSSQHTATPWSFTTLTPIQDTQNSAGDDLLFGPHAVERKACAGSIGAAVAAQYSLPYQDARAAFWAGRDFLKDAARIKAATFIIHGLRDWNVKPTNAGHLWGALPGETPRKLWWFRGGHADPARPTPDLSPDHDLPFPFAERFVNATHRWFARHLKGADVGTGARVSVQDERGRWYDATRWPPPSAPVALHLTANGLTPFAQPGDVDAAFGRFASPALVRRLRLAGQGTMRVTFSLPAGGDTSFVAILYDRGPRGAVEIARGYARAAYRADLRARGPSWPTSPVPLEPGVRTTISFPFWHHDHLLREGHRIELLLQSSGGGTFGWGTGEVAIHAARVLLEAARSRAAEDRRAHRG